MKPLKILGKGDLRLTDNDFIAKGGEGSVYGKGDLVYKVFETPKAMPPVDKLIELQNLQHDNIISPIDIITDSNTPVGYSMKWVKNSEALCKLFTASFRNKENISDDNIVALIYNIMKAIIYIHEKKFVIVDGNEFNYMVDKKDYSIPYLIDVNCWQTPSFPADAILPTVRDYQSSSFSSLTDWYTFAIITFQLFTGIHPFKGKYTPNAKMDTVERMKQGISVLDSDVRVPPSTKDFGLIPKSFMQWYTDLFVHGKRVPPPDAVGKIVSTICKDAELISSNESFNIQLLKKLKEDILFLQYVSPIRTEVIKTKSAISIGGNTTPHTTHEVVMVDSIPVLVTIKDDHLDLIVPPNMMISKIDLNCHEFMIVNNSLLVRNGGKIVEIGFKNNENKIIPTMKMVWNVMPNSTTAYSNMFIQSFNGRYMLTIPVVGDTKTIMLSHFVDELNGWRIINAKHLRGTCILSAFKGGEYKKVVVRFNSDYDKYDVRWIDSCDDPAINFVVLPNNICCHIPKDGEFEVFSDLTASNKVKQISNNLIELNMTLVNDGVKVLFTKGKGIYQISLK